MVCVIRLTTSPRTGEPETIMKKKLESDSPLRAATCSLSFGALTPPLAEQLKSQRLKAKDPKMLEHWQKDGDALTRICMRGLITDGECHRARKRLMKKITPNVIPENA